MKEENEGSFGGMTRKCPLPASVPHAMIGDNPDRKEYIIPRHLVDQMPEFSVDFNTMNQFRRELNDLNLRTQADRMREWVHESMGIPASFLNNLNKKQVKSFEKNNQYVTICANQGIKESLMEYARASGVPTLCANTDNYKIFPHIGWSGTSVCGFDAQSSAVKITVHQFINYCDNWKEAQRPVIKLNPEQTIKVIYEDKIVLAGCNHQYKLPFKLIDEIHAKIHEQDEKKELVKFGHYEWLPVYNSGSYYEILRTAEQYGVKFHGEKFEGTNFDTICIFFDCEGGIQWGGRKSGIFTPDRELSKSQFLERCINHNK